MPPLLGNSPPTLQPAPVLMCRLVTLAHQLARADDICILLAGEMWAGVWGARG